MQPLSSKFESSTIFRISCSFVANALTEQRGHKTFQISGFQVDYRYSETRVLICEFTDAKRAQGNAGIYSPFSSSFQRAQDSSRALILASFPAVRVGSSPARMKPWPAPS